MKQTVYTKNMKVLRQKHPILEKAMDMAGPSSFTYQIEDAKNGAKTLGIKSSDKMFQVHSKYDPEKEAVQQVLGMKFQNPRLVLILGLGLGYHIRACLEKLADRNHFMVVIEKDIQALHYAVKNVDLTDLFASDKIRWVIGVPETEAYPVLHEMIKHAGIAFQLFLKTLVIFEHPVLSKIHGEYFKVMMKGFREAAHTIVFNYGNCPKDSMIGVENIMGNLSRIMRNPGVKDLYKVFRGVPGIVVSTGPSLDKNINELKAAEGKCVMICADSALRILHGKGIKPHAVTSLERIKEVADLLRDIPPETMSDIWLAGTPVIMPVVYEVWKGPTFMVYRSFAHFEWINMPKGTLQIGPSCSNMAFKILEALGCDPIILVGQDCSFKSVEKTHADGAHSQTYLNLQKEKLFPVRGNCEEWVYTDTIYDLFRRNFVTDVAAYRGTCVNATEGGAFIDGTKIMPLRDAIEKYCSKPIDTLAVFRDKLHYPTTEEIDTEWKRFHHTMTETRREVMEVIKYCENGEKLVTDFENELEDGKYSKIEDFLERFPNDRLDKLHGEMTQARGNIILFGKYFNLYLMHIVQMIIVKFEMDFNELPSICDDQKRCKLQSIRMMKKWFPTIGDVCKLSLKLLEDAYENLIKEFGTPN